jgi:hypothetical protein
MVTGNVVVPVDVGVHRVGVPDERQVGEEPVVHRRRRVEQTESDVEARAEILELGVAVGDRRSEGIGKHARRAGADLRGHQGDDRLRALLLDGVEDAVGDFGQRLVPADRFELALSTFADTLQRLRDAIGGVK